MLVCGIVHLVNKEFCGTFQVVYTQPVVAVGVRGAVHIHNAGVRNAVCIRVFPMEVLVA